MKCLESAKDLYAQMNQGKMMEAFEKYYADNCVIVEADGTVRKGKDAQREALKQWSADVKEHHGGGVTAITANEETGHAAVESWGDMTFASGQRAKMEEVALQKWQNGKIVHERFYYNMPPTQ